MYLAVVGTEDGIEETAGGPVMDASQAATFGAALAPITPPALNGL